MSDVDFFNTDDSQGLLGHFVGTVIDSFWSNDLAVSEGQADYQGNDKTKLFWHVRVDDVLQEDYSGTIPETLTVSFSIGDKWWPNETGDEVRHEDDPGDGSGRPILFRANSTYGKFLNLITGKIDEYRGDFDTVPLDGGGEVSYDLHGVGPLMRQRRTMDTRNSKIWNGCQFEFRGLGVKYRSTQGDPRMRTYPTRFVAFVGNEEADASPDSPTETSTPHSATADPGAVAMLLPPDTDPSLVDSITTLVSTSGSHTEFMKNALLMPDVRNDEALKQAVMDEAGGPWSAKVS